MRKRSRIKNYEDSVLMKSSMLELVRILEMISVLGYGNIDDLRKQALQEAEEGFDQRQKPRPQTAAVSNSQMRPNSSNKKFKMLKELARLN